MPCQILEGYVFLGNYQHLGAEIAAAFMAAVSATAAQMVRSVLLARPGLEARARPGAPLQEMVRGIPSDLYRTCLARVRTPSSCTACKHFLTLVLFFPACYLSLPRAMHCPACILVHGSCMLWRMSDVCKAS
jgi:hypothetical protein